MSRKPINLSPDLKKLRDEGYDLEYRAGYLIVKDVPYVNSARQVKRGTLIMWLKLAGDVTDKPDNHVAHFQGEHPCDAAGNKLEKVVNDSTHKTLAEGVVIDHTFSAKPKPADNYDDYYSKVTTYVAILGGPAGTVESGVTAKTFPVIEPDMEDEDDVFNYLDTASSRSDIELATKKLKVGKVAIVGLGGSGSYILDLLAKAPIKQIHVYDGDTFSQHNAFRSPGAPSIDELRSKPKKVAYFHAIYSKMRRDIIVHDEFMDGANVEQLRSMDFVFLSFDGPAKELVVRKLEEYEVPFIDIGMGIQLVDESLGGILRVTTSTAEKRDHVFAKHRIPFTDGGVNNDYAQNIQVADLNALNAVLAVIRWKKYAGFYRDYEKEHFTTFTLDGNQLTNEDRP